MKRITTIFILAILSAAPATISSASDTSMALEMHKIETETINKIQTDIIDPILGKGSAFVFANIKVEIITKESEQSKEGFGQISRIKTALDKPDFVATSSETSRRDAPDRDEEDLFAGFDFGQSSSTVAKPQSGKTAKQKANKTEAAPDSATTQRESSQQAQQGRKNVERRYGAELETTAFTLKILHDSSIPKEKLDLMKEIVLSLYPRAIQGQRDIKIVFYPAPFAKNDSWLRRHIK